MRKNSNHKSIELFERPEIVLTPNGGDMAAIIQLGLGYRKYVDNDGGAATAIDLVGYPFILSEDAMNIAIQIAENLQRTCKPKVAAAMAFHLWTNDYGQRIRLVMAIIHENSIPQITVDSEWFGVPPSIDVLDRLPNKMNPYQLWVNLVQEAGLDHVARIRMVIDRAYRELKYRGQTWSHSHATALMYD